MWALVFGGKTYNQRSASNLIYVVFNYLSYIFLPVLRPVFLNSVQHYLKVCCHYYAIQINYISQNYLSILFSLMQSLISFLFPYSFS